MIEVEIRSKVEHLEIVRKRIIDLGGKFLKKENQVDKIFGRDKDLDKEHKMIDGRFVGRITRRGDNMAVEFKEVRRAGSGHEFRCVTFRIEDGVLLLQSLDYKEAFTISKVREEYELQGFKVCLDEVLGLGYYIEVEREFKSLEDKDDAVNECSKLLNSIDRGAKVEPKKYGDLMQEKLNKK